MELSTFGLQALLLFFSMVFILSEFMVSKKSGGKVFFGIVLFGGEPCHGGC